MTKEVLSRRALPIALAVLLLLLVAGLAVSFRPTSGPGSGAIAIGGAFTLTAPDGHSVSDADFHGKWLLVYFGYTHCPDACPTALNSVANALDMLHAKRGDIAPVFITVDPARDTPAVMGRYVGYFDRQITGLTGTQAQIEQVEAEYHVYAARHPGKDGNYTMDHSSILYVMGKDGHFNSLIDAAANPGDIAARLNKLDS